MIHSSIVMVARDVTTTAVVSLHLPRGLICECSIRAAFSDSLINEGSRGGVSSVSASR
jgi:hypothetical protein